MSVLFSPEVPETEAHTSESIAESLIASTSPVDAVSLIEDSFSTQSPAAEVSEAEAIAETADPELDPAKSIQELEEIEREALREQSREQLESVVAETVRASDDEFKAHLAQSSLQELVTLIEQIVQQPVDREIIRKIPILKKQFEERKRADLELTKDRPVDEVKDTREAITQLSTRFTEADTTFKKRKQEYEALQQREKEENTSKKKSLLEELKSIVDGQDGGAYEKVKKIQDKWKEIGHVVHEEVENFKQSFRLYLDQFYALRKQHNEAADINRKVNLSKKEGLIAELKSLIPTDLINIDNKYWNEATDRVKIIFQQWKESGPAPREVSEQIWQQFKDEYDRFFEFKRAFFENLDEKRQINAKQKLELIEKARPYQHFEAEDNDSWKAAADFLKALQEEWKNIGPAPSAQNRELQDEFSAITNSFFERRKGLLQQAESEREKLLERKRELLNRANEIKDNESLQQTAAEFKTLQRLWRDETGTDNYKEAKKLANQFRKICDAFFKRYGEFYSNLRQSEEENLQRKLDIIARLEKAVNEGVDEGSDFDPEELKAEFDAIGHVPIKEKDKLMAAYRQALDAARKKFNPGGMAYSSSERRGGGGGRNNDRRDRGPRSGSGHSGGYVNVGGAPAQADAEERKLLIKIRSYEQLISQYENNILFIAPGKKNDRMRKDIQDQIEIAKNAKQRLDAQLAEYKKQLALGMAASAPQTEPSSETPESSPQNVVVTEAAE